MADYPRKPMDHLKQLLALESADLYTVIAFALAAGLMALATPVAVQALVNTIAFGVLLQPLVILSLTLFACLTLSALLNAFQIYVIEMVQRRLYVRLVSAMTYALTDHPDPTERKIHGSALANYYFEVMTVQKAWVSLLLDGLAYGLQTLIGFLLLAFYHPALLAFDVLIVAVMYLIFRILGTRGVETAIGESQAKHDMARWLQAIPRQGILAAWGAGRRFVLDTSNTLAIRYLEHSAAHFRVVMKQQSAILALHALANTILLGLGGWMVIERQLTLGQLAAAELIVSAMLSGLTRLGKSITSYYELMAGMDKLSYLLDLPLDERRGESLKTSPGGFEIEAEALIPGGKSIRAHEPPVPLTFKAAAGSRLAVFLAGRDAVDRLLGTLGGLVPSGGGSIKLNGIELSLLDRAPIREHVMLLLRPEWFEGRILDNLRMGRQEIPAEAVYRQLEKLEALPLFTNLPDGLYTRIARNGFPLDDSTLALLSLARSLIVPPPLLLVGHLLELLDERQLEPALAAVLAPDDSSTRLIVTSSQRILSALEGRVRILREETLRESPNA